MFGFGILDLLKLGAGAIAGAIIAAAFVTLLANASWIPTAREEAKQEERAAQLQKSMDLIQERNKTNENVSKLDDSGLCAALGGVFVNGQCQ